jgi:hypothetical protein
MTTAPRLAAGRPRVHIQPPIRLYHWFYVIPDFRFGGFTDSRSPSSSGNAGPKWLTRSAFAGSSKVTIVGLRRPTFEIADISLGDAGNLGETLLAFRQPNNLRVSMRAG